MVFLIFRYFLLVAPCVCCPERWHQTSFEMNLSNCIAVNKKIFFSFYCLDKFFKKNSTQHFFLIPFFSSSFCYILENSNPTLLFSIFCFRRTFHFFLLFSRIPVSLLIHIILYFRDIFSLFLLLFFSNAFLCKENKIEIKKNRKEKV